MQAIVNISLKDGVLDPQGRAISHSLNDLGFNE
ncbi:phosphoribosylformylglycinamidine synthase subunit PurS, partial [Candidatus Puniceispirillum sp.]|nr:phosphoribosylformylglycinamidine synthase subunit PurS [Candidatus Puniceispirillum sp.]